LPGGGKRGGGDDGEEEGRERELFASDEMDVVHADLVVGVVGVVHLGEGEGVPGEGWWWWRRWDGGRGVMG